MWLFYFPGCIPRGGPVLHPGTFLLLVSRETWPQQTTVRALGDNTEPRIQVSEQKPSHVNHSGFPQEGLVSHIFLSSVTAESHCHCTSRPRKSSGAWCWAGHTAAAPQPGPWFESTGSLQGHLRYEPVLPGCSEITSAASQAQLPPQGPAYLTASSCCGQVSVTQSSLSFAKDT